MFHHSRHFLVAAACVMLSTACGSDDTTAGGAATTVDAHSDDAGAPHAADFAWGTPGEADSADRLVEITANDDMSFAPAEVAVQVGETVTFRVTNGGKLPHDFTLGDEATQMDHDAEMAEMAEMGTDTGAMHEEPNAMSVGPGESAEMTWMFAETGDIMMGCHVPGHYAAGMHGDITISPSTS